MKAGIKVFAPASVANVACGFDILGFALDKPGDEIIARPSDLPGLSIARITGDEKRLPYEIERNTAGFAAYTLMQHLDCLDQGIELEIHKKMPFGSGLGSSAASAAGAVVAVNELLGRPLTRRELLPFAVLGEQVADGAYHADNVAPSLIGGIVLIRDNATLDFHRIPVPKGLIALVIYPHIKILTKDARDVIAEHVSLQSMIVQTGNIAGLVLGLIRSDFELISRSLHDDVIENQRSSLIPFFYDVKEAALKAGALGCSISGAGPSIFAMFNKSDSAEQAGEVMKQIFSTNGISSDVFISNINHDGTVVY
ncbi:MAG: homoserine kinase [Saprospiraceae bacterium]|nr:homoserine kinase [Saprospiraceae bacterium]